MPLIQAFSADADYEDKPVEAGRYPLRITSVKVKEAGENAKRPGAKYIAVGFAIEGADGASTLFHNFNLPWSEENPGPNGELDEPAATRMMMRDLMRFFKAFGIPNDAAIEEDTVAEQLVGLTSESCTVTKVEQRDRDTNKPIPGEFKNELRLPRV